jgi:hypothetical protein
VTYYDTLDEDLARAKQILARGKPSSEGLPPGIKATGGTIFGGDIYAAYKLLESFVAEIDRRRAVTVAPDLIDVLRAASHSLKSYAYGNASIDLAWEVAAAVDAVLAHAERPQ